VARRRAFRSQPAAVVHSADRVAPGRRGLNTWDLSFEEQAAQLQASKFAPVEEIAQSRTRTFHPYTPGVLMLHSGHTLHQIAAVDQVYPDDERITLQGHGLYCDGAWTIYW